MASENTLRYTKIDYQSHKAALLQRVKSRWPLAWNDFSNNNLAMMLVDLIAWTTSTWAFLLNRLAAENFVTTMTLRESAVRVGALTGYKLRGPVPATLLCEASLATAAPSQVKISKGTLINVGEDSLPFEVKKDYYIETGATTPVEQVVLLDGRQSGAKVVSTNVKVKNGDTVIEVVDKTIDLSLYIEAGQSIRLPRPSPDNTVYVVQAFESEAGAGAENTKIAINPAWSSNSTSATETIAIEVIDRRIALIQGQTLVDRFVTPSVETKNLLFRLSQTPIIDGSIKVTVNGTVWAEVENLATENESQEIYEVRTLASGVTTLRFGDGTFGAMLPTDAVLIVSYRVGGGSIGNIPLNSIASSITGFLVSFSNPVNISVRNETAAGQGGRNAETLEEARVNIPFHTKTNNRAVTLDDWQALARSFAHPEHGSVAYARADVRTQNSLLEGNIVYLYAWTTGPEDALVPLNSQLKTALKEFLKTKAVATDYPVVADGTQRPVPVSLRFKVYEGFDVLETQKLVKAELKRIMAALRPGSPVVHSNLLRALDEVQGVDTVSMATPISDLLTSNPSELFTNPIDDYTYKVTRTALGKVTGKKDNVPVSGNYYSSQLPVSPLAAWSFKMFLGGTELTVVPDTSPGYARLIGEGLIPFGYKDDTNGSDIKSTVNLLTGEAKFAILGSPGDLTMQLVPFHGYNTERLVNVYIGFSGTNTAERRSTIRAALRAWSEGLSVGGSIFADKISGITQSESNIKAVVESITGTGTVKGIALDNPASKDVRINANEYELLKLGSITLNNRVD